MGVTSHKWDSLVANESSNTYDLDLMDSYTHVLFRKIGGDITHALFHSVNQTVAHGRI